MVSIINLEMTMNVDRLLTGCWQAVRICRCDGGGASLAITTPRKHRIGDRDRRLARDGLRHTCAHHPQLCELRTQELQFCSRQQASKRLCCTWLVRRGVGESAMTTLRWIRWAGETRRAEDGMEAVVGAVIWNSLLRMWAMLVVLGDDRDV